MFSITSHQDNGTLTLYLEGTFDISTVAEWNSAMESIGSFEQVESCIVDFTGLEFIDSTGIGTLLDLIYLAEAEEFSLEFIHMSEEIHEVLDIVGIFDIKEAVTKGVS